MANYMWIIATKHKEDFTDPIKLPEILNKQFPDYKFRAKNDFPGSEYYIEVQPRKGHLSDNWQQTIYMDYQDFTHAPMFNRTEDIEELDKQGKELMADKLIYFLDELEPNLKRSLSIRHHNHPKSEKKIGEICDFFRQDYFQAYIFDEGIHPEFMMPFKLDPKKPKPSFVKRFWDFLK